MTDDGKIIELFFERNQQAIQELDAKYGKVCRRLSHNILNDSQDAKECLNDAYLAAWNAIPPTRPNPLLAYIAKIVRNISLNIYYRETADKRSSYYTVAMEEIEACIAAPNTVEAEIEAKELSHIIGSFAVPYMLNNSNVTPSAYPYVMVDGGIYLIDPEGYATSELPDDYSEIGKIEGNASADKAQNFYSQGCKIGEGVYQSSDASEVFVYTALFSGNSEYRYLRFVLSDE